MIDFLMIATRTGKRGVIEIYPKFIIKKSKDLMIRVLISTLSGWKSEDCGALTNRMHFN